MGEYRGSCCLNTDNNSAEAAQCTFSKPSDTAALQRCIFLHDLQCDAFCWHLQLRNKVYLNTHKQTTIIYEVKIAESSGESMAQVLQADS